MSDEGTNALAQRAAQIEAAGIQEFGKYYWDIAMQGQAKRIQSGERTQADLLQDMSRNDAVGRLFHDGMSCAPQKDYEDWRATHTHRQARISRTTR